MSVGSHWDTCWKDSSEHWECALLRIEQQRIVVERLAEELTEMRNQFLPDTDRVVGWRERMKDDVNQALSVYTASKEKP